MNKQEIYNFLNNLSLCLKDNLLTQKVKIVRKVKGVTPKGGEPEGNFIKLFLEPLIKEFLKEDSEGLIVEGIDSKGQTQFKGDFFGSKPAPDFRFKAPLPFTLVGEVKYGKLQLRSLATALGQLITYIESSESEAEQSQYGYLVFFDTKGSNKITEKEKDFIKLIWKRENIFIAII